MGITSTKKQKEAADDIKKKRAKIKKQLKEYFNSNDSRTIQDKLTDIYNEGVKKFLDKGYDHELAEKKTIQVIGLFVPNGYAIHYNKVSQKIDISIVH